MIRTHLFRKHYAITALVVGTFIVLGFLVTHAVMRLLVDAPSPLMGGKPDLFFAKMIDSLDPQDRVRGLKRLEQFNDGPFPFRILILDEHGHILSSSSPKDTLPFAWNQARKPTRDYESVSPNPEADQDLPPPPGPGMPPMLRDSLIRFTGSPVQYLYFSGEPQFPRGPKPFVVLLLTTGTLLFSMLAGVGFALFLLFRSMGEKVRVADGVIDELRSGNLKARFPAHRMDEFGQAMSRFNQMADEIEHLVERLCSAEKARNNLLQDLTHDLRTPVASMKNLLVTLEKKSGASDQEIRAELISLAQKEVDYFERLVEDLLILAQISEPAYKAHRDPVGVLDLLREEVESVEIPGGDGAPRKIHVRARTPDEGLRVRGDIHLLRRLFRNALENAYSFARSEVVVTVERLGEHQLEISIQDDGPGFSEVALKGFGERHVSRTIHRGQGHRISVGLGSVIMKTVAELHRGKVHASNRIGSDAKTSGALVRITLES